MHLRTAYANVEIGFRKSWTLWCTVYGRLSNVVTNHWRENTAHVKVLKFMSESFEIDMRVFSCCVMLLWLLTSL